MIVFSKTSDECKACKYYDDCDNKRMVACALAEMPEPMLAQMTGDIAYPIMEDILVKHDYRDIKVADGMTITIDLEEMKKQIERDFYKSLNCPWLEYGA